MSNTSSEPTASHEFWLLDAAGRMMDHDTLADAISFRSFDARKLPGVSIRTNGPLPRGRTASPVRAIFRKRLSLPFPFPDTDLHTGRQDLVCLQSLEDGQPWLASDQERGGIRFTAMTNEAEAQFLPLSRPAFTGLGFLHDREQAEIRNVRGQTLDPARFMPDAPHHLTLGDVTLSLAGNLAELDRLGTLPVGKEDVATLQPDDNPARAHSFIVRRLK